LLHNKDKLPVQVLSHNYTPKDKLWVQVIYDKDDLWVQVI